MQSSFSGFTSSQPDRLFVEFRDVVRAVGERDWNEHVLTELIDLLVTPGTVCVDCGANAGKHTLTMAKRVAESGRVFAFEPNPAMCQRIRDRLQNAGYEGRVSVMEMAVGDREGEVDFNIVVDRPALSRIDTSSLADEWETRTVVVPIKPLDAALPTDVRPSFIKIDVEGHEWAVLRGAAETIRRAQPVVFFEANLVAGVDAGHYTTDELFGFLDELRYDLFSAFGQRITRERFRRPLPTNHFAIPASRSATALEALHCASLKVVANACAQAARGTT